MERGSVQHGPRLDEALAEGSELPLRGGGGATEREDLRPELPGDDELPDLRATVEPEPGPGPDPADVRERSELARWLEPSKFPADAATLVAVARGEGAPDAVLAELALLAPDVHYETVGEVWRALGGEVESRESESGVAPDTDLGEAVALAMAEVAADVVEQGSEPWPLVDDSEITEAVVVEEVVEVVEVEIDVERPTAAPSDADTTPSPSLVARALDLTIVVVDLALLPTRIGWSVMRRVLHLGEDERGS